MEEEIYVKIKETNNRRWGKRVYEISNYGNIKCNNLPYKPKDVLGYYIFCAGKVHRIVAELFVPNPENKPIVDHIDCNTHNNHYTNLRWVTAKENSNNPLTLQHHKEAAKKRWQNKEYRNNYINKINNYFKTHTSPIKGKKFNKNTRHYE